MKAMNLEVIQQVANQLAQLDVPYALAGGVAVYFLLDNPNLVDVRPTDDIDAIAAVVTRIDYTRLEERLRTMGFENDVSKNAPPCRYIWNGTKVDVMPAKDETGRFSDRWFLHAVQTAKTCKLESVVVRVISAPCLIATKLTAFKNRGRHDFFHHDIEDIVTVIDGRHSVVQEVFEETTDLKMFISQKFRDMLNNQLFVDSLPGHLPGDFASQQRLPLVMGRFDEIASLSSS